MHIIDKLHRCLKTPLRWILRKGSLLDRITRTLVPEDHDDVDNPAHIARIPILFGVWMVVAVFGVLGLWSAIAELESAAIAPGQIVVNSNSKVIDHLEGGIVEKIMVSNGEFVKQGAPLIRLQEVRAKAQVDLLNNQYYSNIAVEARLLAERDRKDEIAFPQELLDMQNNPDVAELTANQRRIFTSRTENLQGQLDILGTRIAQHQQEINGLRMQERAAEEQIYHLTDEIGVVEELLEKGYAQRPRLLALKRQAAELTGRKGEYMALQAKAQEGIDETRLSILNTESDYMNKVVEELKEVQLALGELREKKLASSDVLDRVIIRAPVQGVVNNLSAHTVGGVIKPGEPIMEIIPFDDTLIVEARVSPQDIDVVHPCEEEMVDSCSLDPDNKPCRSVINRLCMKAKVRLTAYKMRQVPAIEGELVFVSADSLTDEKTGHSYYTSRIEIDASKLLDMKDVKLYPGMPAEALIITGSQTFLQYMMGPITESFQHSFRQQ